eukprot:12805875-Alexandrium_andersonii.AAC.1
MCAKLNRSLYGTRAAPALWESLYMNTLQGLGFAREKASAGCFFHPDRDLRFAVRGDDIARLGLGGKGDDGELPLRS